MPDVILNDKNLKALIRAFSGKIPVARVGVLSSKTRTVVVKGSSGKSQKMVAGQTNAEIGARHEYGEGGMPERSFLRVPITERLEKFISESGGFNPDVIVQVIKEKSIRQWVKQVGITAEKVVTTAFDTGGFGRWPASNMKNKKVHQTLVETTQLRNSIASEVE